MRVIGAGLGRTGTNSLKLALEQLLGGPCYHMFELFQRPQDAAVWQAGVDGKPADWHALFDGWAATVDWPGAPLFDQLADAFPEAKVLLSVRDGDAWYRSMDSTIFALMRASAESGTPPDDTGRMVQSQFAKWLTLNFDDKAEVLAAFDRHNQRVRDTIPADRLIEWHTGEGWESICAGLDLPIPEAPFPHANAGEDFTNTVAAARSGQVERGFDPNDE